MPRARAPHVDRDQLAYEQSGILSTLGGVHLYDDPVHGVSVWI